jgi:hypothetical protein
MLRGSGLAADATTKSRDELVDDLALGLAGFEATSNLYAKLTLMARHCLRLPVATDCQSFVSQC